MRMHAAVVPLPPHSMAMLSIDEASFQNLLSSAPTKLWHTLQVCLMINITGSSPSRQRIPMLPAVLAGDSSPCPECRDTADIFGDHQVGCSGYVTWSSLHPSLQPWPLPRRPLAPLPAPSLAQLISFYPIGKGAVLQLWMSSPLQQQTLNEASFTPGHALQVGVNRKLASSLSACRSAGLHSFLW